MENKKNWIYLVITILALGGGGYGACVAMTDSADEELTMGDVADPGVDTPPYQAPDAGLGVELDPPEANPIEVPTDPLEGVTTPPEMEMPENPVAAIPPREVIEGVELERRQEPCDGDPSCEDERQRPRDDRMTGNEPGPVD